MAQLVQQAAALHPADVSHHLSVIHHSWLYLFAVLVGDITVMVTYMSPMVRASDLIYRPVKQMLGANPMRVVVSDTIPDPDMMFGSGEFTVYQQIQGSKPELTRKKFESFISQTPPCC